jgi:hypothetical protein
MYTQLQAYNTRWESYLILHGDISNFICMHWCKRSESDDAELSDCTWMVLNYLERVDQHKISKKSWSGLIEVIFECAMRVRFAHITSIQKSLFGAHFVATQLSSVCLIWTQKSAVFPSKNLILDIFFPFMVTFHLSFRRWFWARFGLDFWQPTYFIMYFVLLVLLGFCYFW